MARTSRCGTDSCKLPPGRIRTAAPSLQLAKLDVFDARRTRKGKTLSRVNQGPLLCVARFFGHCVDVTSVTEVEREDCICVGSFPSDCR